jgi:hypothetical protein
MAQDSLKPHVTASQLQICVTNSGESDVEEDVFTAGFGFWQVIAQFDTGRGAVEADHAGNDPGGMFKWSLDDSENTKKEK